MSGELLGDEARLCEEALQAAGSVDGAAVLLESSSMPSIAMMSFSSS